MTLQSSWRRLGGPLLFLFAVACSSGGNGPAGVANAGSGNVSITLADGASTTLSMFEVDVRGIVFERRGGGMVTVAPRSTRIDFAQLDGLNDLVATASLPAGNYARVSMTLDFSAAKVLISGLSAPAEVRDLRGSVINGPIEVLVDFAGDDRLVVGRGRNHLFAFDLDLDQSVSVDSGTNVVTFTPVLNLEVDPSNDRPIGTGGVLRTVDTNAGSFVVDRLSDDGSVQHTFTVATTGTTLFQVNGVPQVGALGLGSLIGYLGQRVFVQGELDRNRARIDARFVEAGAGVLGNGQDVLFGHVVARNGGAGSAAVLTVRGKSTDFGTGTRRYDTAHTVNTSLAFTRVLRRSSGDAFDTDDINVGQLVWVFGDLSGTTMNATASDSVVRLVPTALRGTAVAAPSGNTLTLNLSKLDWRDIAQFDFTVAGQSEANPAAFGLDVTGLATAGILAGTRVESLGWFRAVGTSGPDAVAITLAGRAGKTLLFCEWAPPTSNAVTGANANALTLDLTGTSVRFVRERSTNTALNPTPAPTIRAAGSDGHYRIVQERRVAKFRDFATFRSEVLARTATASVFMVGGRGTFDAPTQTLTATDATVVLR